MSSILDSVFPGCEILRDITSGGDQYLPLSSSERKSRKNDYCNVDILILKCLAYLVAYSQNAKSISNIITIV